MIARSRLCAQARLYSLADSFLLCCLLAVLAVQLTVQQAVQLTPALVLALGAVAAAACLKLRQVQEGASARSRSFRGVGATRCTA